MSTPEPTHVILPAEYVGEAWTPERVLVIGIPQDGCDGERWDSPSVVAVPVWCNSVSVYVRRDSADLSVIEIHMTRHDGLAQEELDQENDEAERYPLGPKEYWRSKTVGKSLYGADAHLMTDAEFEADWDEQDPDFGDDDD